MITVSRPRLRRERDRWWSLAATLVGLLALLGTVVALLAHELDSTWQPLIVLAAFAHQAMWAAPVAVVLLLVARRRLTAVVAVVALLLAVATQAPLYRGAAQTATGARLTVLQANLRLGTASAAALVRTVTAGQVDVLMTEELTTAEVGRLVDAGLTRQLRYRYAAPRASGGAGLGIWSRFPLHDRHDHPAFALGVLSATAQVSATRTVTLVAVHLLPPYPYPPVEWTRETARLRPLLRGASSTTIAAGDFNATTDNAPFRALLHDGYRDAAEQCGAGYLASYPADRWFPPLIAIDHVLTRGAQAGTASTVSLPGSDHRGLLVRLRLDR